jgi:hypothetical protein
MRKFVQLSLFTFLACMSANATTYYVSKSLGNDSNTSTQAQSKSTPWQHVPGMASGPSHTPIAGDAFILYGGDTWGTSDLNLEIDQNGSGPCVTTPNSSCIYIGVDVTWFKAITGTCTISGSNCTWVSGLRAPAVCVAGSNCGGDFGYLASGKTITINSTSCTVSATPTQGSANVIGFSGCSPGSGTVSFSYNYWTRPIWTQSLTYEAGWYAMAYIYGENVTLDNIEFTGMMTSGGNTSRMAAIGGGGGGDVIENCYFHGWEHSASGDSDNSAVITGSAPGDIVHDNVIDGDDTLAATAVAGNPCSDPSTICQGMNTAIAGAEQIYNNYIANVTSGIATSIDIMHDNWMGPIWLGYTGGHRNGVQQGGGVDLGYLLAYNNILTAVQNGGMGGFWLEQGSGNSGLTAYVFNNVLFNGAWGLGEGMQFCQEGSACGPFYGFNNTMEAQFNLSAGVTATANLYNNHCIQSAGGCPNNEGVWTVNETTDKAQCAGTGSGCADQNVSTHFDQYTDSQTYALSPVAITNSTVGTGTNEKSICTTISGLNTAAGTACLSDTSYACAYNTNTDTISCPDRTENSRPVSAAWDIGAYEFSGAAPATPTAPALFF